MAASPDLTGLSVFLLVFLGVAALGLAALRWFADDEERVISRLRSLGADASAEAPASGSRRGWVWAAGPRLGALVLPKGNQRAVADLQTRLLRAGFFHPNAPLVFAGAKLLLMLALALGASLFVYCSGWVTATKLPLVSVTACAAGMIAPSFWLDVQVRKRQRLLRHALPDALDMLVLCVEGGVSLHAALQRVAEEVQVAQPALGVEMNVIQREVELGLSPGAAFKKFADRCGLPDVRDLASVIQQSERFGASVTKALRAYAEGARVERQLRAEETAQKAAVKILFPTLLCIFPAIFIVLLGPAAFQITEMFAR